jgi:hypothetical protein
MIHTAIRAAQDNLTHYVDPKTDPAMFNMNVALLNIARTLLKLQNQIDDLANQKAPASPAAPRVLTLSLFTALGSLRRLAAMLMGTAQFARRQLTGKHRG